MTSAVMQFLQFSSTRCPDALTYYTVINSARMLGWIKLQKLHNCRSASRGRDFRKEDA